MTISGNRDIEIRRENGANVLLVARDSAEAYSGSERSSLPHSSAFLTVASLVAGGVPVDVIDFTSIEDGLEELLGPFRTSGAARLHRRRQFATVLGEIRGDLRSRIAEDDTRAPRRFLMLFGVHRARDLDPSSMSLDSDPELIETLTEILREGPEMGIHTWIWSETVGGLTRRLPSAGTRECSWRLAGVMSPDDSASLLGVETAAKLRDRQLLVVNDDIGVERRFGTYTAPDPQWTAQLIDAAAAQHGGRN